MIKLTLAIVVFLVLIVLLKQTRPEYAYLTRVALVLCALVSVLYLVNSVVLHLSSIIGLSEIQEDFLTVMLKVLGISIITEIAVSMCRDSGESALATVLEIAGKSAVIAMSLPIIKKLLEISIGFMK